MTPNTVRLPQTCACDLRWTCGRCYVTHMQKTHRVFGLQRPDDAAPEDDTFNVTRQLDDHEVDAALEHFRPLP